MYANNNSNKFNGIELIDLRIHEPVITGHVTILLKTLLYLVYHMTEQNH